MKVYLLSASALLASLALLNPGYASEPNGAQLFDQAGIEAQRTLTLVKVRNLTTDFSLEVSPGGDSVNIAVSIDPNQLRSINDANGYVEVRFYAGAQYNERRVRENKTYTLNSPKQSFTLPYKDVCPSAGPTSVRVWTSVKGTDRSYKTSETSKSFYCSGSGSGSGNGSSGRQNGRRQSRETKISFKVVNGQVNAKIQMNPRKFSPETEVQLSVANSWGFERRLPKTYKMPSPTASFTFPPGEVCDQASFFSYDRNLKVEIGPKYGFIETAQFRVTCKGGLEILFEEIF